MSILNSITKIEDFFENVRFIDGVDFSQNLSWGYYFSHFEKDSLETIKNILLLEEGYSFGEIVQLQDDSKYYLHIEKIEKHTTNSLLKRDMQLNNYAKRFKIDSYDGFDVENYSC